jgi:hypothetical protein
MTTSIAPSLQRPRGAGWLVAALWSVAAVVVNGSALFFAVTLSAGSLGTVGLLLATALLAASFGTGLALMKDHPRRSAGVGLVVGAVVTVLLVSTWLALSLHDLNVHGTV